MPEQRSDDLLKVLVDAGVEFVVVGGLAAIAHGMDRSTKDLDIVAKMTVDNMARLVGALEAHQPRHLLRKDLGVITVDSAERLAEFNYILVETTLGRLDVLARVEPVGGFDDIERITLALPSGSRSPSRRKPETRTMANSTRINDTSTLRRCLSFRTSLWSAIRSFSRTSTETTVRFPRLIHPAAVERGIRSSGNRYGLPVLQTRARIRWSYARRQ